MVEIKLHFKCSERPKWCRCKNIHRTTLCTWAAIRFNAVFLQTTAVLQLLFTICFASFSGTVWGMLHVEREHGWFGNDANNNNNNGGWGNRWHSGFEESEASWILAVYFVFSMTTSALGAFTAAFPNKARTFVYAALTSLLIPNTIAILASGESHSLMGPSFRNTRGQEIQPSRNIADIHRALWFYSLGSLYIFSGLAYVVSSGLFLQRFYKSNSSASGDCKAKLEAGTQPGLFFSICFAFFLAVMFLSVSG
jgi:hypothetical protein